MRKEALQNLLDHLGIAPPEECVPAMTAKLKALADDHDSTPEQLEELLVTCEQTPNLCSDFTIFAMASTLSFWRFSLEIEKEMSKP